MFKINVKVVENKYTTISEFDYLTGIPPIIGDRLMNDGEIYVVIERTLAAYNPNFIMLTVTKNN